MHAFYRLTALVALVLFVVACGAKQTKSGAEDTASEMASEPVVLEATIEEGCTCEVLAEFGVVEARSVVEMPIRVKNNTDEPIVLVDYSTTCRCTTLALPRTAIEAGGESEVVLTFDSRGEWGGVGNFLEVETSNPECGFVVWMAAMVE
jgi:hypothetical protein